jgi:hypothetical protein
MLLVSRWEMITFGLAILLSNPGSKALTNDKRFNEKPAMRNI